MIETALKIALAVGLLLAPWAAQAQDTGGASVADTSPPNEAPVSNLSWSVAVTSDYVYRGITQSNYRPALQAGLNYAFGESGFYAGVWGSNVDFADTAGPNIELDAYIGYAKELSDDWNLDLFLTHYSYLGSQDPYGDIDFNQLDVNLSFNELLTFTTSYSNDYVNGGYSYRYYGVSGEREVGHGISLNASVGHSKYSGGNGSYTDYSIGASRQFGPVNAALNYIDTNIDDFRASDRVVLTLTVEG